MKRDPMAGAWVVQAMIVALILLIIGHALGIRITLLSALGALAASGTAVYLLRRPTSNDRTGRSIW